MVNGGKLRCVELVEMSEVEVLRVNDFVEN